MKQKFSGVIAHTTLITATAVVLLPFIWVLLTSLKTRAIAYQIPPKLIFTPTFESYFALVEKYPFPRYFLNSLIVALSSTLIALFAGSLAAYSISRFKTGGAFLTGWILNSRTMPAIAVVLPFFMLFRIVRLDQTVFSLIIAHLTFVFPMVVIFLVNFFNGIPRDLEEAAQVDGCTQIQALLRIVMPLASPGMLATGIIAFIFSWNEFLFALVLTGSESRTLPVAVANFLTHQGVLLGELSASTVVLIIPATVMAFSIRKYFVSGLTMGAIK